jgi:hypothetical protein
MSQYAEQASNLLESLGIKFSAKYLDWYHFEDELGYRNIYQLKLSRLIKGARRSIIVRFEQRRTEGTENVVPSSYDLLASLTKYDPGSFESWCAEFGYNDDSRKAYAQHRSVVREWKKVQRFFSEAELELIREI